jgi:WD repeat-containing protein 61
MLGLPFPGMSNFYLSRTLRLYLCSSADKSIKVWDIGARAAVSTIQESGEVWSVCWRPKVSVASSAGAFVSGGEDGVVKWWRAAGTG